MRLVEHHDAVTEIVVAVRHILGREAGVIDVGGCGEELEHRRHDVALAAGAGALQEHADGLVKQSSRASKVHQAARPSFAHESQQIEGVVNTIQ